MRKIEKYHEPNLLTLWRAGTRNDTNYGYKLFRQCHATCKTVEDSLRSEQKSICAYTGLQIDAGNSHIEHLLPQSHCSNDEETKYTNLVACYPRPGIHAYFGAVAKENWPPSAQVSMFISPLSNGCEQRFNFNFRGVMEPTTKDDTAALETINRLKLNHVSLVALRKEAIDAILKLRGKELDLNSSRKRLKILEEAETSSSRLEPFCFVLKQVLLKHIKRLEPKKAHKRKGIS